MNRQEMLAQIDQEIETNLPSLGFWQALGLGLMVLGLVGQGWSQLSKIAEEVPEEGSYNTVRQRVKRWVSNPRLDLRQVRYEWIKWVWRSFGPARAVLLVDETKLGERFGIMMVSLAYAGRAIPLFWRCYYANSAQDYPQQGQVLLIYGLLAHVLSALPTQARPLVQMDRGLAHSSAMLRALKDLGVDYLVRVKQTARFTNRRGHSHPLSQLVTVGEACLVRGALFTRERAVWGSLCLIWEVGQAEAWCLFTNVPRLIGQRYALRWWQEESFKDLKSGGWQWRTSRLTDPQRMERLILVMTLAYAWCISLGTFVWRQPPRLRAETATPDALPRLSLFHLGRRFLRRVFAGVSVLDALPFHFPAPALFLRL
jgi:hypothetical protein